jgi:hypothetical protein
MAAPKRREVRIPHLNAHIVPVEQALIARAEVLEQMSRDTEDGSESALFIAAEFRALAEECHWRG